MTPNETDKINNGQGLLNFIKNNPGLTVFTLLGVGIFIALIIGIYQGGGALLDSLKNTEVARGLITFLVTFTTVSIAILLAIYALGSGNTSAEVKERFSLGMQILTALIGILGTVLGFYFATLQPKPAVSQTTQVVAATPDDAKTLVKKAVEFYKSAGKEKALAEFSNLKGQFVQDKLFIYVLDLNGKVIAHPKADFVGKDFLKENDAEGKAFSENIVKEAKEKGHGQVDFKWKDPKTEKVESKTLYCEKVDDVIICSETNKK
jgi:cytochrome c